MTKPAFQSEIGEVTVAEGDSLQTRLIITGDPEPYAKWYINNQMVYQTEDTEIKVWYFEKIKQIFRTENL